MRSSVRIAETILTQLGGGRFIAMVGAKAMVRTQAGLQFNVPANLTRNRGNKVRITLDASDTYTIEIFRFRPSTLECETIDSVSGIYADCLRDTFTDMTGLATSL